MSSSPSSRASSPESSSPSSSILTTATEGFSLFDDPVITSLAGSSESDEYILVVGGLGYIGSHTSWELLKDGHNVIIVDNLSNSFRSVLDRLLSLKKTYFRSTSREPFLQFYEADYRDQPTMNLVLNKYSFSERTNLYKDGITVEAEQSRRSRISGVIHFAAYKAVAESIRQPLKYYSNNVGGLISFCSLLSDFGIKTFVFSSSATVYGEQANGTGRISEEYCTHETTSFIDAHDQARTTQSGCTGLTNPYGRTKWMCEAILHDLASADPEWSIFALRYFNPVGCDPSGMLGEDPRSLASNLMPAVVKTMTGESPVLQIYGTDWDTRDGTAVRDFIHVTDLARGHLAALVTAPKFKGTGTGFQAFNLGSGIGYSVLDVVAAMEAVSGRRLPVQLLGRREGDVAVCIAEPTKAAVELGWRTEKSLEDSCTDICRFLGVSPAIDTVMI
jgi:UDP-glucose 4-epimerase